MNSWIEEKMTECINEYSCMYNLDKYITTKMLNRFYDKYKDVFNNVNENINEEILNKIIKIGNSGYESISNRNIRYIKRKMEENQTYFDNMFEGIDEHIKLDNRQRKAIIADEDYSLVVAGAGSGKTTTMAAKAKYLVDKQNIKPDDIILLSFTNKAAEELSSRVNVDFKLGIKVLTFHKLGMQFLREITNKPLKIIGDEEIKSYFIKLIEEEVFQNKKYLKELINDFESEFNLDSNWENFASYDEYYNYYMNKKYEETIVKGNIKEEISKRIASRTKYLKTINGEYLKSEGEVKIANYMYKKGIKYEYERPYPNMVLENRSYSPDFTIYNFDEPIYIEYYGLSELLTNGLAKSTFCEYNNILLKKRKVHQKHKTELIELFGRYEDKRYFLTELSKSLKEKNIIFEPREDKEIFYRLMETSKDWPIMKFVNLLLFFISNFKEQGYDEIDFDKIYTGKDELIIRQLNHLRKFYENYEKFLRENSRVDFQDMINYSYKFMSLVKSKNHKNYKYLIIDEYQDISNQRYNFIKKLADIFDSKIVAVGDDWQAIFSFSGSDVNLFTKFTEMLGYGDISEITKTYRNSQELIDLAGEFISKNPNQLEKHLISDKHMNKPIEIIEYENDFIDKLIIKLKELYFENSNQKILLLGRYNMDFEKIHDSGKFIKINKNKVILREEPKMNIDIMTVHSSKGLGYDQVILLNAVDCKEGFPSKIENHPLIELIKPSLCENIDYPEERRLFYVALTRTKNKLYIMTPKLFDEKSEFVKEIMQDENVLINEN